LRERAPLKPGRRPLAERTRRPEDAPPFATGHYIRLEALTILHEGEFSAVEIAEMMGMDVKNVTNHLRNLYDAGCIEFVGHKAGEGNIRRAVYRAIARPVVSDEAYRAMSLEERHDLNGTAIQWIFAECLSSHRSGKMDQDEDLCLISDEPNLDAKGRVELRELLSAAWSGEPEEVLAVLKGVQEIECRAANRMAESGETGTTVVVALLAFERGRSGISERQPLVITKR
jgi:DNA-binding transcriptional ArsR family regulator